MKTKAERIYQEARNMFARDNGDAGKVFDEACVKAFQGVREVRPIPENLRDEYLRRAEAGLGITWGVVSRTRMADAVESQQGDRNRERVQAWSNAGRV